MSLVTRITADGYFVEDVVTPDGVPVPEGCIASRPPAGMKWPRWQNDAWADANVEYAKDDTGAVMVPGGSYVTTERDAQIARDAMHNERVRIARKLYVQTKLRPNLRTFLVNNTILTQAEVDFIAAQDWTP